MELRVEGRDLFGISRSLFVDRPQLAHEFRVGQVINIIITVHERIKAIVIVSRNVDTRL